MPGVKRCPLAEVGVPPVWPTIPETGDYILYIGEAPGDVEQASGKPFAGRSGKDLRLAIDAAGMPYPPAFANVELRRPHDGPCTRGTNWNRTPNRKEVEPCLAMVVAYIQGKDASRCKGIVCIGGTAVKWVRGLKGAARIGSHVGRLATTSLLGSPLPVTAMWHPAYLMRLRGDRKLEPALQGNRDALATLAQRLRGDPLFEVPYTTLYASQLNHRAPPDVGYEMRAERAAPVAIDVESDVAGAKPDPRVDRLTSIQVAPAEPTPVVLFPPDAGYELRVERAVFHNAQYDLPMLLRAGFQMPQHVADTMVMAHLLGYETLALKPLVRKLLGLNVVEHAEQPVGEEFQAYAAQDARITLMLFNRLYPEIKQAGLTKLYEIEMALQPILAKASLEGFAIDRERLAAYEATTRRALDAYTDAWFSLMGQVNPLSPAQVLRAFRAQGLNIASTNEQALASYAEGGLAEAILLLGIRGYRKALGYIKQMQEAGDRITCLWQTTYVETGRLSARSPNLMNFPPMARACLRADPGRVLIAPDYSSQELRIAACLSEDPVMLELLRTGTDLHVYTAERAYDLTPDLERNWKEEPWAGMRARAKTRNFESLYGGGEEKAAYVLGVPLAKAHELAESWPGWYSFVQSMARLIETDPDPVVHTYWGRPRHVSNVRQAVNTPIQGTAGEITKLAMVLLDRMLGDEGGYQLAGRVVHQVHDSVILEVVEDRVEELKERALECMLAAVPEEWQKLCPWPSDVYTGTHWY